MKRKLEQSLSENRKTRRQRHVTLRLLDIVVSIFPDDVSGIIAEYAHHPRFGLQEFIEKQKRPFLKYEHVTMNFPNELLEECIFFFNIQNQNNINCLKKLLETLFSKVYLKTDRSELDAISVLKHLQCWQSINEDILIYIGWILIEFCNLKYHSRKLICEWWVQCIIECCVPICGSQDESIFVNQFLGYYYYYKQVNTQKYICPFH